MFEEEVEIEHSMRIEFIQGRGIGRPLDKNWVHPKKGGGSDQIRFKRAMEREHSPSLEFIRGRVVQR